MLNKLFKRSADNKVVIAEPKVNLKGKTTNQIIEEIHESFYTEVDRLLASAKISNSLDTDKTDLLAKCERLKSLGFTNTKEVKEAEAEIARLNTLEMDNKAKAILIEAINYFSFKYPNYKFITEDSVKKICEKYNLVYGAIDRYIGNVPDKNLKHIEDFMVFKDDQAFMEEDFYSSFHTGRRTISKRFKSVESAEAEKIARNMAYDNTDMFAFDQRIQIQRIQMMNSFDHSTEKGKCPLEIAAPLKDFNMGKAEVKDFKISNIEIPDPVVLYPVVFAGQKHYLIVTAWGIEASDELVVNQKFN